MIRKTARRSSHWGRGGKPRGVPDVVRRDHLCPGPRRDPCCDRKLDDRVRSVRHRAEDVLVGRSGSDRLVHDDLCKVSAPSGAARSCLPSYEHRASAALIRDYGVIAPHAVTTHSPCPTPTRSGGQARVPRSLMKFAARRHLCERWLGRVCPQPAKQAVPATSRAVHTELRPALRRGDHPPSPSPPRPAVRL